MEIQEKFLIGQEGVYNHVHHENHVRHKYIKYSVHRYYMHLPGMKVENEIYIFISSMTNYIFQ